ncbi:MAG: cupin domain-containing protein [candidate division NC10 bacterium]|nr:cupin domain-containing protein [candidate division NC10 bacterium]
MERKALDAVKVFSADRFVRRRVWQTDNLHCNIYCFEPGQQNSLHRHPVSNEVIFCWEGEGVVVVGEGKAPIRAGETVLVPVNVPHGYINTSTDQRMIITVIQCPLPVEHVPVEPSDIAALIRG